MVRQRALTRRLLIAGSIFITLGAIVLTSVRTGMWPLGAVPVQVFDPNSTLFPNPGTLQGVLVCAPPGSWGNAGQTADLSYLHIVPDTSILDQRRHFLPTPASRTDLRRGQRLRVWATNPLFSYPSQVSVQRLVIEDDGQGEPLDCHWRGLQP